MNTNQLESYFMRMGMAVPERPTLKDLTQIQERHIYAIPVENLDIIREKLPLSLEVDDLVAKVVKRRRGGLSFELNLLLSDALRDLGYDVKLMSAKHPKYGHEFDHAFLLVEIPGDDGKWIVDVGFTECYRTPLLFDCRIWQSDGRDDYRFAPSERDGRTYELLRRRKGVVELVYSFNLIEHRPEEYRQQCDWFCTNGESRFTQGPFAFIERPEGRICYSMDSVFNTFTGEQIRPVVQSREDENAVLREIFGIEADEDVVHAEGGEKFAFKRVFAAIGDDALLLPIVDEAVRIALDQNAHVRFGHIVRESDRNDRSGSFPDYVQAVRTRLASEVERRIGELGASDRLLGGEVVVMGSNTRIGATIDTPADYAPEQLVESLIKPFNPAVVVCGDSGKSRLQSFIKGSTSAYLAKKLDCELVKVTGDAVQVRVGEVQQHGA